MSSVEPKLEVVPPLDEQLVGFLADGIAINWLAATALRAMSPEQRSRLITDVKQVIDQTGPEAEGVLNRSGWLDRLAGEDGLIMVPLMVEAPSRQLHEDRAQDSVAPLIGALSADFTRAGRHTSLEVGRYLSGHRIQDRFES